MKTLTGLISQIIPLNAEGGAQSLRLRVQHGSFLTMGGFGAGQVLRLGSNLILTRLVAPEAFGLMAVAVSINIWAIMLTDIGIGSSVIRSKNSDDPEFLRTAWTMKILRNALIWLLILLAAGAVYWLAELNTFQADSIYANSMLPWVMMGTGAQVMLGAFSSMNLGMAQRKLALGRVIGLEIGTQVLAMIVTISFAASGYGVWALVIGMLVSTSVSSIASHFIFPGPSMRLMLRRDYFFEIFNFGKWLIIASFFGFLVNRGDQILFGGYMDSNSFSLYAIAAMWVTAAAMTMQTLISRIFFPAFSEIIRERPHALNNAYRKSRLLIDAASVIVAFGAFFLAEPAFALLYPDNYAGVGYYVKLLSPFLLLTPFRLINTLVLAGGDSKNFTGVTVLAGLSMLVTPIAFSTFGEKAAIVCFSVIELVALPIIWRIGAKRIDIDPKVEARALAAIALILALIFWMD
jgi:O-antigen/teichoic acid export membrane protein